QRGRNSEGCRVIEVDARLQPSECRANGVLFGDSQIMAVGTDKRELLISFDYWPCDVGAVSHGEADRSGSRALQSDTRRFSSTHPGVEIAEREEGALDFHWKPYRGSGTRLDQVEISTRGCRRPE